VILTAEQHTRTDRQLVNRYFETWNTGDSTIAGGVLHPEWRDRGHPEIAGPDNVRRAVQRVRDSHQDLRFDISAVLSEGELLAAVGEVSRGRARGRRRAG